MRLKSEMGQVEVLLKVMGGKIVEDKRKKKCKCPHKFCGYINEEESSFCEDCGKPIQECLPEEEEEEKGGDE